jgi:hypothetical protein
MNATSGSTAQAGVCRRDAYLEMGCIHNLATYTHRDAGAGLFDRIRTEAY